MMTYIYPRDVSLARYLLSSCVYPSVRPSVTRRYCVKTAKSIDHANNAT